MKMRLADYQRKNAELERLVAEQTAELTRQKRELEVEAALERVRARTITMQRSDELTQTASQIYIELEKLGINPWAFGFNIWVADQPLTKAWSCSASPDISWEMEVPHTEDLTLKKIYKDKNAGKLLFMDSLKGKALQQHFHYMTSLSGLAEVSDDILNAEGALSEQLFLYAAYFKQGYLLLTTTAESQETESILAKFAKAFEQTYTRFLDLQKAEALAREAQIEAALERVRARTMAMQKSEELMDVVDCIFRALEQMGYDPLDCTIVIFDHDAKKMDCWSSMPAGQGISTFSYSLPYIDHPMLNKMFLYHHEDHPFLIYPLAGEEKVNYDNLFFESVKIPEMEAVFREIEETTGNFIFMSHGAMAAFTQEPMNESDLTLLQRFSKVVDLSYTRFLDLKKAEMQARDAQIEAALERVRARTMAMHDSDELIEAASLLFHQISELGIRIFSCGFSILNEEEAKGENWHSPLGRIDLRKNTMRMDIDPHLQTVYDAWKEGADFFRIDLSGAELEQHFQNLGRYFQETEQTQLSNISGFLEGQGMDKLDRLVTHHAYFSHGLLLFSSNAPVEEIDILKRFARVFEQTYTRFLDLQKAEGQAREAQIEVALERVRAQTMAMHRSDDLREVVATLYEQLVKVGLDSWLCILALKNEKLGGLDFFMSNQLESVFPTSYHVPHLDHPIYEDFVSGWEEEVEYKIIRFDGKSKKQYDKILLKKTDLKNLPEQTKVAMKSQVKALVSTAYFKNGMLQAVGSKILPNDKKNILIRFTKVFEQTYTRFLDLRKAEARAIEAARTASLDRVRAEIASMRKPEDLERITPLIWQELITLGVPFFRCGVFIIREPEELVHAYLSTPKGQSLAVLNLPFDSDKTTRNMVEYWRRQEVYTDHWNRSQFQVWVEAMVEQGQLSEAKQYQAGEAPPESLSLQFLPFMQGMLYVGSSDPLSEDQLILVKALAEAFSVAYARYEDFTKLEEAKNRVESTLTELQATQNQLIQQEKLASLGQLTAGIAHEIKNPLNFVNNFSEVSQELLEELREEIKKGDWAEVEAIAGDLEGNLAKIYEHGHRADGIVQSMLMHARGGDGHVEPTDLNPFVEEYVNLAYHGMRAGKDPINISIDLDLDEKVGEVPLVVEDFSRVILNLCNNAFDAMRGKWQKENAYHPRLSVRTELKDKAVQIDIADNGPGIPDDIRDKILQPFFTTKKGTAGTGLGLSISHDIVKAHSGTLQVQSKKNEATSFIISLPTQNLKL